MNSTIPAKECVLSAKWLPEEIQKYLLKYSVAVNRLSTPYPERELIDILRKYSFQVRQFVVAYEVPPGFTRKWQYATLPWYSLDIQDSDSTDMSTPWLYGLARDFDDSLKVIHFMRENIMAVLRKHGHQHVLWAYDQFVRMRSMLTKWEQSWLQPLSLVWILPGRVASWWVQKLWNEYQELIRMAHMTNANSARFVQAALKRIAQKYKFEEEDIIILGSNWALGKTISKSFPHARNFDIAQTAGNEMYALLSRSSLILDCTNGKSLSEYYQHNVFQKWKRYVWVVESYPVPEEKVVQEIEASDFDINVLHIKWVGTKGGWVLGDGYGNIIPFPVYWAIMPCCTGRLDQPEEHVITGELYDKS